jgi:ferredoxin
VEHAAMHMGRHLETDGLPELLKDQLEHPQWDDIAKRCLACANCTMVCPTCFCSTVEDITDLTGEHAERWRRWDSCFSTDFTKIAGGNIRMSTKTRYRQWMTHKLSNWLDQFGTFGCVGCGRCITWCPAGIDITAEAAVMRESSMATTNG